jgi:peroxiredoxin (alkyl hydroperoxide reductase subunit C)
LLPCNEGAGALRCAALLLPSFFSATTNHKEVEPMSIVGTKLKPFQATAYLQGKFVDVSDADVLGKWGVFFFYPADFTFVCPTELEDLADSYEELKGLGVEVYSVSTDTHFSHKAWHDSSPAIGKINYYMLGDQNHTISNNFGILREGVGLADRGTFVVDPDGVIQLVEITPRAWAAMPPNSCARSRLPSTGAKTPARSARPSGKKAPKPWLPRSTSSARSKPLAQVPGRRWPSPRHSGGGAPA